MARGRTLRYVALWASVALAAGTEEMDAEIIRNLGFYQALAVLEKSPAPPAQKTEKLPPAPPQKKEKSDEKK